MFSDITLSICKHISRIHILSISSETVLRWMSQDLTDDWLTLVQVMAWCHQATSHCLSQRWPRFISPYGVTRPQWVKIVFVPYCHRLPTLMIHIISQVKTRQSESYIFYKICQKLKFWNFEKKNIYKYICGTPSDALLQDVYIYVYMKWIMWLLSKIQSRHDSTTDGRTDGQGQTSIPLFQLSTFTGQLR